MSSALHALLFACVLVCVPAGAQTRSYPASLDELLAKVEAEKSLPAAQRISTLNQFSRFRTSAALDKLEELWRQEKASVIRSTLLRQLGFHEDPEVFAILKGIFEDPAARSLHSAAAYGLVNQGEPGLSLLLSVLDQGATEDPRLRSVLYALRGKNTDPGIQKRLVDLLRHSVPYVRQEALQQLTDLRHEIAPRVAREWLGSFDFAKTPAARQTVFFAIALDLRARDVPALLKLARAAGPLIFGRLRYYHSRNESAARQLGKQMAEALLREDAAEDRRTALRILEGLPPTSDSLDAMRKAIGDSAPSVRALAVEALARREDGRSLRNVERLLKDDDPLVRTAALRAAHDLGRKHSRSWARKLLRIAEDDDLGVALTALDLLAEMRDKKGLELAWEWFESESWQKRSAAISFARLVPHRDSVGLLIARLDDPRGRVAYEAMAALRELTGKRFPKPEYWVRWWNAEKRGFRLPKEVKRRGDDEKVAGSGVVTFYGLPIDSNAVSFVIDTSGSMSSKTGTGEGTAKIEAAKRALQGVIKRCDPDLSFNLIWFQSNAKAWEKELLEATKEARARAQDFVRQMRAGGGTNVYDALELAFRDPKVDTIYLLSDGAPSAGKITDIQQLADEVRRWNRLRRIKIHGISIGADSVLLKRLAEESGGRYQRWI